MSAGNERVTDIYDSTYNNEQEVHLDKAPESYFLRVHPLNNMHKHTEFYCDTETVILLYVMRDEKCTDRSNISHIN